MRYIQVWADYMSTGVRDENSGFIDLMELGLTPELIERIEKWVAKYRAISILDDIERVRSYSEILYLDNEGIEIARTIQVLTGNGAKVTYYSEGQLRILPI